MKATIRHIVQHAIRLFLMLFWLYVALDKLWDLPQFHQALVRQPFPDWWADILYWFLPTIELVTALLFIAVRSTRQKVFKRSGSFSLGKVSCMLSAFLLLIFSGYIALGLIGFYEDQPCGCASALSSLTWRTHLLVNVALLLLSGVGWYLCNKEIATKRQVFKTPGAIHPLLENIQTNVCCFSGYIITVIEMFRMRFALFPGRPVNY